MTAHEVAQRTIAPLWRDDFVYGVIETALKRPGRGRSAHGSNQGGWRYEERRSELERFHRLVARLIDQLRLGTLTAEAARRRIDGSGYAGFVVVAESMHQTVACLAEYLKAGDNAWVEGVTDPDLPGHRVIHWRCWYDPSHARIA